MSTICTAVPPTVAHNEKPGPGLLRLRVSLARPILSEVRRHRLVAVYGQGTRGRGAVASATPGPRLGADLESTGQVDDRLQMQPLTSAEPGTVRPKGAL